LSTYSTRAWLSQGRMIKQGMRAAADKAGLQITISGIDCWASFKFGDAKAAYSAAPVAEESPSPLMTLYTQEMLRRGFLSYGTSMPTYAHKEQHIHAFIAVVEEVFGLIAAWLREASGDEMKLSSKLLGPVAGPPAIPKRLVR
jgi:glutamate-1-semialdehyde 2,1-aminomutase